MKTEPSISTLHEGNFLRLQQVGRWEYVERTKANGVVAILAVTDEGNVILIEQYRPPLGKMIVEIPAGLSGDHAGAEGELLIEAARRELLEETGYHAAKMEFLFEGPSSAGLTTETVTFFLARELVHIGPALGDGSEQIVQYEIPICEVEDWLAKRFLDGRAVDCKIYTALFLVRHQIGL